MGVGASAGADIDAGAGIGGLKKDGGDGLGS
jgi:hypothetical protein